MPRRVDAGDRPGAFNASLTLLLQNQWVTPFDTHEDPMLDPESNVAEQLAHALRHHQKNLIEKDTAEKKLEALRQLVSQLENVTDPSNQDA